MVDRSCYFEHVHSAIDSHQHWKVCRWRLRRGPRVSFCVFANGGMCGLGERRAKARAERGVTQRVWTYSCFCYCIPEVNLKRWGAASKNSTQKPTAQRLQPLMADTNLGIASIWKHYGTRVSVAKHVTERKSDRPVPETLQMPPRPPLHQSVPVFHAWRSLHTSIVM